MIGSEPTTRLRIAVFPAREHTRRTRLFAALEAAYPVIFQARATDGLGGLDGAIAFGGEAAATLDGAGLPGLAAHGEELDAGSPGGGASGRPTGLALPAGAVSLARAAALDRPLHGARLSDRYARALPSSCARAATGEVLATLDERPAWVKTREEATALYHVGCAPAELRDGEALRERLEPGRCLAMLALVQFLRNLVAGPAGSRQRPTDRTAVRPPVETQLHATFLIDDPNLHRPRYGHLRYRELLRDARAHGYHLAVAMVPLDGWFADSRVARMFREGARHLSVCVHGNEHDGPELSRPRSTEQGIVLGAQALRRAAAFERRTGVAVDRVMVPPHEQISEPMAHALHQCGFRALCTTRPYPWLATTPQMPWLTRPADVGPLAGWRPTDVVAGGLPVLLRSDFALHPREELVLRAFLGQPLILYGHHEVLRGGPAELAAAAAQIDALGTVRWSSLGEIAGALRRDGASQSDGASQRESKAMSTVTDPVLATVPHPPRRLRPIMRRVAAESEVRLRALLAPRSLH